NNIAVNTDNTPPSSFQIYLNNFIIGANATIVSVTSDAVGFGGGGALSPWDNGTTGNYWSDYAAKYPNATEIGNTGVGDTPYLIRVNPTVIDIYPVIAPVTIQNMTLASPSQASTSSFSPTTAVLSATASSAASSPDPRYNMLQITLIAFLTVAMVSCIALLAFRKREVRRDRESMN